MVARRGRRITEMGKRKSEMTQDDLDKPVKDKTSDLSKMSEMIGAARDIAVEIEVENRFQQQTMQELMIHLDKSITVIENFIRILRVQKQ